MLLAGRADLKHADFNQQLKAGGQKENADNRARIKLNVERLLFNQLTDQEKHVGA